MTLLTAKEALAETQARRKELQGTPLENLLHKAAVAINAAIAQGQTRCSFDVQGHADDNEQLVFDACAALVAKDYRIHWFHNESGEYSLISIRWEDSR